MNRASIAFLLIPIVCASSCARGRALRDANDITAPRLSMVGTRLAMRSGPELRGLPPDQRFRFISPDSLVTGVAAADKASIEEPYVAELRKTFATVMGNGRWVESDDSAQFDVTIFTTSRTKMQPASRTRLEQELSTCGDRSTGPVLIWCPDASLHYTESWLTVVTTFHIIRRRSDGAVRVWRGSSRVDAELLEMLRTGEGR